MFALWHSLHSIHGWCTAFLAPLWLRWNFIKVESCCLSRTEKPNHIQITPGTYITNEHTSAWNRNLKEKKKNSIKISISKCIHIWVSSSHPLYSPVLLDSQNLKNNNSKKLCSFITPELRSDICVWGKKVFLSVCHCSSASPVSVLQPTVH